MRQKKRKARSRRHFTGRPTVVRITKQWMPRNLVAVLRMEEKGFVVLRVS